MRQYSSYLFDFDGTLTATLPHWHNAIHDTLKALGVSMSEQSIITNLMGGWPSDKSDALIHLGISDAFEFSDMVTRLAIEDGLHEALLHSGVYDTLKTLEARKLHRALVTNNFQANVDQALILHAMEDMFDVIVTRESVAKIKPDPEMVRLALAGRDPDDAVMVGDTAHDVEAARAAGVTAVVYFPKENERYYSYEHIKSFGADLIIRDFEELLA